MLKIRFPRVPKVNWWYALGEITIVVAGILIALGVNSWWADKQLAKWEKQTIIDLHAEFESNRKPINQFIQLYSSTVKLAEDLLTKPHSIRNLPTRNRTKVFINLVFTPTFDPADAYLMSLIRAGELYKISDRRLRILIAQWVDVNEDLAENWSQIVSTIGTFNNLAIERDVLSEFDAIFSPVATTSDQSSYFKKLQTRDFGPIPSGLDDLLFDPKFEAWVADRTLKFRSLLGELSAVESVLDSILVHLQKVSHVSKSE